MGFYVIGDEDTVLGFKFAGIEGTVAHDGDEARQALDEVVQPGEQSVVIITERLAEDIRERINEIRFGAALPLIVEVPGPEGPSEEAPKLAELIREAVGIKF